MSNVSMIIEERAADLGSFMVGRLLPFRQKRAVGPFVFIDHMGPVELGPDQNFDVGPHPHIGLSTLTYLFEGSIMHRDSLGTELEIKPGAVNWMTAGRGVVHSERTPDYLRNLTKRMHGLQIWVALPKHLEDIEPSFKHIEADDLPKWEESSVHFKLIAGNFKEFVSPVPVYSPSYLIEIKSKNAQAIHIEEYLFGESAIYILEGSIKSDGISYGDKQILIAKNSELCAFEISENSTIYVFGGEPFPEEHFILWNFVSTSKEKLEQAKQDWINDQFPTIPGEFEKVPFPEPKL